MNSILAAVFVYFYLATTARGQLVGTQTPEKAPPLSISSCTKGSGLSLLTLTWRWFHAANGTQNCYKGQEWDPTLCKTAEECTKNCALDGADYAGTYGITSSGSALTLKFVTQGPYSTNTTDGTYGIFKLKNQEFSFDVDVSNLPCGMNGALYFAEMPADGGMKKFPSNKAGSKYGTGYCDAQCPRDIKFIDGKANLDNWTPSKTDKNTGIGSVGSCCSEMDVWEANSISQAFTPHTCKGDGPRSCTGKDCGDNPDNRYGGICDKDGCDFASYRLGDHDFFGPGKTGELVEIRRSYIQDGKVIQNSKTKLPGLKKDFDSITGEFCKAYKGIFGDKDDFTAKGGMKSMGDSMDRGMVLVMSIWDDQMASMLWLDGNYPLGKNESTPGVARGTCNATSGDP
ncbi:family 7 glycoside hydrolase [Melampsora americana]|nr:family 7 glycoside hydrolase [Melampsora americana]